MSEKIIQSILAMKPNLTREAVKRLIDEERAKAAGLLTEEAATYLVASNLGINPSAPTQPQSGLPSYMRPETPQGDAPSFQINEQIEAQIQSIEKVTGQYGAQYQIDVTFPSKNGWRGRAWIKYYAEPAPNQYLGKLCLAIERVTGQKFTTLNAAVDALKSYGRIYFRVSGYTPSKTKFNNDGSPVMYPKYAVMPDILPGEQASAPSMQRPPQTAPSGLPQTLPTSAPPAPSVSQESLDWIIANQAIIGQKISPEVYNSTVGNGIIEELYEKGYIKVVDEYPWLGEKTRELL